MEIKEQYRTVKNEDFIAMEKHIADLERFRRANRIQVDVKISDRRYHRMSSHGYPTGEYVARQVMLNEVVGEDIAKLYDPIAEALRKEYASAQINNQECLADICNEADALAKLHAEVRREQSDLKFNKLRNEGIDVQETGSSIWKWLFFGMVVLDIIILIIKSGAE